MAHAIAPASGELMLSSPSRGNISDKAGEQGVTTAGTPLAIASTSDAGWQTRIGSFSLPNCSASLIVTSSVKVATAILTESALAFLGLGDPNVISWGYMVGVGRTVLRVAWWMPAIPGIAILLTVLCINLVGEGLNEALNPRLQRR